MFTLRYALRNLWRSKARTLVTLLGVASLLFIISFLLSIVGGLERSTETDGTERRLITRHDVSLTFTLPETYWQRIRGLAHVVEVCPSNWYGGTYIDDRNFFARFFVDPPTYLAVTPEISVPPDLSAAWLADRQGALASQGLAEKFGWEIGDKVTLQGDIYPVDVELNVQAIYTGGEDALIFHRKYVEESLGFPPGTGTFTILVDDPASVSLVAEQVDAMFADSEAPTKTETEKAFQASFVQMFGNVKGLVQNLALIIALTILLTAGNTMAMAVRERTHEIAVLKAIGFHPSRLLGLVVVESVALAGLAAVLGVGGFWLPSWIYFVVMGGRLPNVWFPLTLSPAAGMALFVGALGAGLLTGLVPAIAAARRPVTQGLRGD